MKNLWKSAFRKGLKGIRNFLYLKAYRKTFSVEESLLIFSEARSGSTWLMEILSQLPNVVTNWEPLHPDFGTIPKKYKWGWRPFIPYTDRNNTFIRLMEETLSLKSYTPWTLHANTRKQLKNGEIVLTKFVRANLLLPWILEHIPLQRKPILLLRDPVAVCLSQIQTFEKGIDITIPDCMNNTRFVEHHAFLKTLQTPFEVRFANWCLNNQLILQDKALLDRVILVEYEKLLLAPKQELTRIVKELGFQIAVEELLKNVRKGSQTDFFETYLGNPQKQLEKTADKLDAEKKLQLQKIADYFGLNMKLFQF